MDPMEGVNIDTDSSFALAMEAQARGAVLYSYAAEQLSYNVGRVEARARSMTLRREHGNHVTFGEEIILDLAEAGNYVAVRPSGTEPKIKLYVFTRLSIEDSKDLSKATQTLASRLEALEHDAREYAKVNS